MWQAGHLSLTPCPEASSHEKRKPGYKREENRGFQRGAVDLVGTIIVGSLTQYLTPISGWGESCLRWRRQLLLFTASVSRGTVVADFPTFISHSSVTAPAPPRRGLVFFRSRFRVVWIYRDPYAHPELYRFGNSHGKASDEHLAPVRTIYQLG